MLRSAKVESIVGKTEATGVLRESFDLGSAFGEGVDSGFGGGFAARMRRSFSAETTSFEVSGNAEVGVEDDAEEGTPAWLAFGADDTASIGEEGVVGEDGADACEDGVAGVAEELDFVASGGAGEPVRLVGEARGGWRSQFAIEGESGFEGDEGGAVPDEVCEGFVEVSGLLLEYAEGDFDSGSAKFLDALTAYLWVGVLRGDDAAGDSGGDEGVGAGRGAAVVAAGLEGDVGGGSVGGEVAGGGLLEGYDFGVVAVVVEVGAFADCFSVADENAADLRVW